MSVVIKIENVSKQYRLGLIGTNTLKGDLQRWWYNMRGLPDPTLMIGQENSLNIKAKVKAKGLSTSASTSEDFIWALKDINFEVQQGEVLGIIGKNGAGKSTLLKLLSRVTAPTTGSIKVKGRIASLLEVGTGFHPELTGRENIFLNGAILGMTKTEIRGKFDEIVDFAGIAKYIDTPVKRYSSGMYVRLAFAVAAHLEPEILIVDEVLAVGDAEFQKKALGKMHDISTDQGRTVLFVSHNMAAIQNLCGTGLVLSNGLLEFNGATLDCIEHYLTTNKINSKTPISLRTDRKGEGNLKLIDVRIGEKGNNLLSGSEAVIYLKFANFLRSSTNDYRIYINIKNKIDDVITHLSTDHSSNRILLTPAIQGLKFNIIKLNLAPGHYNMRIFIEVNHEIEDWIDNACSFEIIETDIFNTGITMLKGYGDFYLDYSTETLI
jgi:lipopolysaccharide transport system ATP-binding protein